MKMLRRWAIATLIMTFLVVIAGGLVRTTQSGMGCPDWPKCFGRWIPPTNASELPPDFIKYLEKQDIDQTFNAFHTWTEYFNRLMGVLLGLFAIIQCILFYRKRQIARRPYYLSLSFLGLVIATGLFGAIVVKLNLAHLSISVHLLFALLLLQIQAAVILSLKNKLFYLAVSRTFRNLIVTFLVLLCIQSVLGTMVRMYVDDVSRTLHYEQRDTWLASTPVSFLIHRSFSWLVMGGIIFLSWYCRKNAELRNKVFFLLIIVSANMIAGITLFYAGMPAVAQPIHLLLASCAITQAVSIILQTRS
jgi:cytochrome c oxidase assembly protein subunit 15